MVLRDPLPLGEVLAVDDEQVHVMLLDQRGDERCREFQAGRADDVADKEKIQWWRHGMRRC
jgi:hypothetical protein